MTEPRTPSGAADSYLAEWFDEQSLELAGSVSDTTIRSLQKTLSDGIRGGEGIPALRKRVQAVFAGASRSRANLIARTEANKAMNGASWFRAASSGVVKTKTWLATNDARTRAAHRALDGVTIGIGEPFPNGSMFPDEPNCRCTLTYGMDEGRITPPEALPKRAGADYADAPPGGPPGGGSAGGGGGSDDPDDLIRELIEDPGRYPTTEEVDRVLGRIADAPFNPSVVPVPKELVGTEFLGRTLTERTDSLTAHMARRILQGLQWALNTTREEFLSDLAASASHPEARLAVWESRRTYYAAVVAPNPVPPSRRGGRWGRYLAVLYSANRGRINSAYQENVPGQRVPERARWFRR